MYGKVFKQIFDSSIANNWKTRLVFMDMIVLADSDGVVDMTHESIAARGRYPLEFVTEAIKELEAEDPHSRTCLQNGKRIIKLDDKRTWGWQIVNYEKYRETRCEKTRKSYIRKYMRAYRAKKKSEDVNTVDKTCLRGLSSPSPCSSLGVEGGTGEGEGLFPKGFPANVDEAIAIAATVGCPTLLATEAYNEAAARGGKDYRNIPIVSFGHYLASKATHARGNGNGTVSGADKMIFRDEYNRIIDKKQKIRAGYSEHQAWSKKDLADMKALNERQEELRQKLKILV